MSATSIGHPTEEMLEMYALHQLSSEACDSVEEHLLVCAPCQDRLVEVEQFIGAMKAACRAMPEEKAVETRKQPVMHRLQAPLLVFALAAVGLVLVTTFPISESRSNSIRPETEIALTATRGAAPVEGQASDAIRLRIDAAGLPLAAPVRLMIVNQAGAPQWDASLTVSPEMSLRISRNLAAGAYWVRIETPQGELLREFSLHLK